MIKPLGHNILIKVTLETKSKGGIVMAHNQYQRAAMEYGKVMDIGPYAFKTYHEGRAVDDGHSWVKIGDMVYFSKYGGKIVEDPYYPNTEEDFLIIIKDGDILGKVVNNG